MVKKTVKKSEDKYFKYFLIGFVLILIVAAIMLNSKEDNVVVVNDKDVIMYYFYLDTCPHCKEQESFHKTLLTKYPNLKILKYEMTSRNSRDVYLNVTQNLTGFDNSRIGTPTTVIGNQYNVGYLNDLVTGKKLEDMIESEIKNKESQNICKD